MCNFCEQQDKGLFWESNPGPLAPEARIMPLDQTANGFLFAIIQVLHYILATSFKYPTNCKIFHAIEERAALGIELARK